MPNGGFQKAKRQFTFPPAPIETEAELIEIFLQVLLGHPVKSPDQNPLQVGDHSMHQRQPFIHLGRWSGASFELMAGRQYAQPLKRV